jgi:hypothetical protein
MLGATSCLSMLLALQSLDSFMAQKKAHAFNYF